MGNLSVQLLKIFILPTNPDLVAIKVGIVLNYLYLAYDSSFSPILLEVAAAMLEHLFLQKTVFSLPVH
ncbi:MAG: hypothetical protein F6K14_21580 [Symploca sp. SIO2C1]|nr:hypothetical protein [Symploca sp. SIO2C1]